MPHVTPGNRLYLYQLFVREVGVGKQTMLARIEEVLLADDIMPCDMGFEDVRSLLEELSDFVRLTVFRKGRAYATVIAQPEWDEILAQLDKPREDSADKSSGKGSGKGANKGGAKSWKRKKTRKSPKPAKPRPHGRPEPESEEIPEVEETPKTETQAEETAAEEAAPKEAAPEETAQKEVTAREATAPEAETSEEQAETGEPESTDAQASEPMVEPNASETDADQTNEPTEGPEPASEHEPTEGPEPAEEHEPAQPIRQFVHLSVVSEPDPEPEFEFEPEYEPMPAPDPSLLESTTSEPPLPHHITTDVNCGNEQLSILYQLLPFDVDPIALLDEDWRYAQSVEDYEVDGATVTFFLRYLHRSGGTRVPVRMRRGAAMATGKRWSLVSVGDENLDLAEIGFDGLPLAELEAWRELATHRAGEAEAVSPVHELAHYAHLGPWDDLLSTLADLAMPEFWGTWLETLREYLGLTFHRVCMEDKVAQWDDGRTAFDTGLCTPELSPIYMVFEDGEHDGDRKFQAFVTACDGPAPQPAAYVRDLADMTLVHPADLRFAKSLENAYPSSLQDAAQASVARVLRDYRLCAPAYDPIANVTRLLLPLATGQGGIDHALALAHTDDSYLATAVLPLDRAAICARVVSAELPSWLRKACDTRG